jgi:hypothetical protein
MDESTSSLWRADLPKYLSSPRGKNARDVTLCVSSVFDFPEYVSSLRSGQVLGVFHSI